MSKQKSDLLTNISTFIVDKRNLFFLVFIVGVTFCFFSMSWVNVQNDITAYLSEETQTRQGLDVMNKEFLTFGTAEVMISHISYDDADEIADQISEIEGVLSVTFENTEDHYVDAAALFSVMFEASETEPITKKAMNEIKDLTAPYDVSIKSTVGQSVADTLAKEMGIILVIALFVIIAVLLFTSKSYAEIIVLLVTFGVAAILNMGTNFWFKEISFISNSVAVILQLALAVDYAVILCHRFLEEREQFDAREASIMALKKSIPEVSSSSLTTISGLTALSFMNFGIGSDLSMVLIKAILCSLLCVFVLMPGLLVVTSGLIDKTRHQNFVPSIENIGRFSIKRRFVIVPTFLVIAVAATWFSTQTEYLFGVNETRAMRSSETQLQADRVTKKFGSTNLLAVVIPSGDYEKEAMLINALESFEEVDSVTGLANTPALDDYMLTDELTARELSELMDLDYEEVKLLYATYAANDEDYAKLINNTDNYALPLLEVILFLNDMVEGEYLTLSSDLNEELQTQSDAIKNGMKQLESEDYSRLLMFLNLPEEGEETFAFLDKAEATAKQYYDEVYLVGNPTSNDDLAAVFGRDNVVISVLSALFVMVVLLFTFRSAGVPVLLIIIIQSAIFINFSVPYLQDKGLFFLGYLVVSSIQMGANVDYAIVITNRYMQLKQAMEPKKAIVKALDESFATVITSGVILAVSGIIIQFVTTDGTIAIIGECIGRGTIVSIILVLFVLPAILYMGTDIIERTSFSVKTKASKQKQAKGTMSVNGHLNGYVSGYINADVAGTISGEIRAEVETLQLNDSKEEN